jgi:hypothetical protein
VLTALAAAPRLLPGCPVASLKQDAEATKQVVQRFRQRVEISAHFVDGIGIESVNVETRIVPPASGAKDRCKP